MSAMIDSFESRRFALVRILVGLYSVWMFAEMWVGRGTLFLDPGAPRSATATFLPELLALGGSTFVHAWLAAALAASVALAGGLARRAAAGFLWVALIFCFIDNRYFREVHHPLYVWLLLAIILQPGREPWRIGGVDPDFRVDDFFRRWALPAVGLMYTISGLSKYAYPGWTSGEVIEWLARTHWPSPSIESFVRAISAPLPFLSWMGMLVEILALPLLLIPRTRFAAWIALTALQLFILVFYQLENVSALMLILHVWLFDSRWLRRKAA